jgi:thymidylate kinase
MKDILTQLNYTFSSDKMADERVEFLIVKNVDGTPRWIFPASATKPLFLKFYTINSLRSKCIALLIQWIFKLKIQRFCFEKSVHYITSISDGNPPLVNLYQANWAVFTGTVGPNNKLIVYKETEEGNSFIKVASSSQSQALIENEVFTLNRIFSLRPNNFIIPDILNENENSVELDDISENATRENALTPAHLNALNEIYEKTGISMNLTDLNDFIHLDFKLMKLKEANDPRIPNGLMRKLILLLTSLEHTELEVALCHGDFTPWNIYKKNDVLAIYDWELSQPLMPVGFDAFHFIIQKGILVDRKPWREIRKEIDATLTQEVFSPWFKHSKGVIDHYLKLYLVINTVNYLKIYAEQKEWHTQVEWLLNTWNEAISDVLKDQRCHRQLLIMDFFDFMSFKKYATIKFSNNEPESLSEMSDLDICIEEKDLAEINSFLKNHPLVSHHSSFHKSFMDVTQVLLANGKLLSLDLIWKFKRKSLVMLEAHKIIENATKNSYGMKIMSILDLKRYVGLFYGLNNSQIPVKYQSYKDINSHGTGILDDILYANYLQKTVRKEELEKFLKKIPQNRSFRNLANVVEYCIDSFRQIFLRPGLIMTFSGVDGAGKSTVIQKTKTEIEKKLRKRVIVLRHRPSLLPILSAWVKGKAKAEADATEALPRQGNNKSKISSIVRFAYYYVDYVFGQFYVLFKYKIRGYVVIYDRYYFDFIVDSKRSNIEIPQNLAKMGYGLLMKPELNFFLYAKPEEIRNRKKELEVNTIEELTDKYKTLFNELDYEALKSKTSYEAIENIDLAETLQRVFKRTLQHAA